MPAQPYLEEQESCNCWYADELLQLKPQRLFHPFRQKASCVADRSEFQISGARQYMWCCEQSSPRKKPSTNTMIFSVVTASHIQSTAATRQSTTRRRAPDQEQLHTELGQLVELVSRRDADEWVVQLLVKTCVPTLCRVQALVWPWGKHVDAFGVHVIIHEHLLKIIGIGLWILPGREAVPSDSPQARAG